MMQPTHEPYTHSPSTSPTIRTAVHTLRAWKVYLYQRKLTLLIFALCGLLTGMAWWLWRPVNYLASTSFVVEGGDNGGFGLGQFMEIAAMFGVGQSGGEGGLFEGDNIMELYKSRRLISNALLSPLEPGDSAVLLIDRLIREQGLERKLLRKAPVAGLRYADGFRFSGFADPATADSPAMERYKDSILHVLVDRINKKHLRIGKPDRKLDILRVDVQSADEYFSKRFNEQLVETVNRFYIETRTRKSAANVAVLEHKVDSVRQLMDQAIFSSVAAADATPNLNPTRQVRRMVPVQQAQFDMEVHVAVLEELVKNLEMARLGLSKETPLIEIIDAPVLPLKKDNERLYLLPVAGALLALFLGIIYLLMRRTVVLALRS